MSHRWLPAIAGALACDGSQSSIPTEPGIPVPVDDSAMHTGVRDSASIDTAGEDSGTPCGDPVDLVSITAVDVTCGADDYVTFGVTTAGVSPFGFVFAMETPNQPPWSEEHDLWSREYDACGAWSRLEMRVITQSVPGAPFYERNVASLFACGAHFESDVMTYAFAALDASGNVADCVAAGIDPDGLVNGDYDSAMIDVPSFDLGQCAIGVLGS